MLQLLLAAVTLQASPLPIEVASRWAISDNRGGCTATAGFGGGVSVRLRYDHRNRTAFFTIANRAWRWIEAGSSHGLTVRFDIGPVYRGARATGFRLDDPSERIPGVGMQVGAEDFLAHFARARSATISVGEIRLDPIGLRGSRDAVRRLVRCAIETQPPYASDPVGFLPPVPDAAFSGGPGRGRANLASYFSTDDYPAAALRANEEGTTGFRITIGPNGRVTDCTITSSSGSVALDQATCRIIRSRARYSPARDSRGSPTAGTDSGLVTWSLPVEPDPAEPAAPPEP